MLLLAMAKGVASREQWKAYDPDDLVSFCFEAEAAERRKATEIKDGKPPVSKKIYEPVDANEQRAAAQAAKACKTNRQYVADAKRIKEQDPAAFEAVKSGQRKLTAVKREKRRAAVAAKVVEMPAGKYRVFYADPPWSYGDTREGIEQYGPAERHYPAMPLADICALELDVRSRAADDAVLFLWATSPLLPQGLEVIRVWGFTYKASFVWHKLRHNFGHYNSVRHEFLLIGTRGSCVPDSNKLPPSVVEVKRGIYRDALDLCYANGGIPRDEKILARMLCVTDEEFAHAWPVVSKRFVPHRDCEDLLINPRAQQLIESVESYRQKAAEAGRRGAKTRWGSGRVPHLSPNGVSMASPAPAPAPAPAQASTQERQAAQTTHTSAHSANGRDAEATPFGLTPSTPNTPNGNPKKAQQAKWFSEWWAIWPKKVGRTDAEKAFHKRVTSTQIFDELMRLTPLWQDRVWRGRDPDKRPYPATFLNREPWRDGADPQHEGPDPDQQPQLSVAERLARLREHEREEAAQLAAGVGDV